MKDRFKGWYPKGGDELSALWDRALFVPDANVLLHCIRHPAPVRDELLRLFETLRESLWIPHQVGLEFHRNRLDVEIGAEDAYDKLIADYDSALNQAREKLRQMRAHPIIDGTAELAAIDAFLSDFRARMNTARGDHPKTEIPAAIAKLTELLDGRVGERWPPERLTALKKEGEDRYARKVPPGYKDARKDGDGDKFGDLIIWRDIIDKAKAEERPVIFISDDVKEDWWWLHRGRKLGPRPELVEEFSAGSGQDFHIYEFMNFLRVAGDRHPEIKKTVEVVAQSLRDDERARRRRRNADEAAALRDRISDLEDERERLVQALSGTPGIEFDRETTDRNSLRSRLEQLNSELRRLNDAARVNDDPDDDEGEQ